MKFWRFMSSLDLGSWKLGTDWLCMAAANHMPQLKQYCSGMFKREDWEVAHLHKLIEKEYENHTIQMPVYNTRYSVPKWQIIIHNHRRNFILCYFSMTRHSNYFRSQFYIFVHQNRLVQLRLSLSWSFPETVDLSVTTRTHAIGNSCYILFHTACRS